MSSSPKYLALLVISISLLSLAACDLHPPRRQHDIPNAPEDPDGGFDELDVGDPISASDGGEDEDWPDNGLPDRLDGGPIELDGDVAPDDADIRDGGGTVDPADTGEMPPLDGGETPPIIDGGSDDVDAGGHEPDEICLHTEAFGDLVDYEEGTLRDRLRQRVSSNHRGLGYDSARYALFTELHNEDNRVRCVYTSEWVQVRPDSLPNHTIMNTEHTWPQSRGTSGEPAKSDLHHLYPTKSDANSYRGNHEFGDVRNVSWSRGGSSLGTDSSGRTVFESRPDHRGDVARALLYMAVRYGFSISATEEEDLRLWHTEDPVEDHELDRNDQVQQLQGNRNPFVDCPGFVQRISNF